MFDIRNAQRSFNNSWLLRDCADIPSGVILDIAVTTPLLGDVYIAKMTADGGYLSLVLKQGDIEIAYMRTDSVGSPVRLSAELPGVCAVVVLGYIPEGLWFTNPVNADSPPCVISPELVTYFDYRYLTKGPSERPPVPGPGGASGNGLVSTGNALQPTLTVISGGATSTYTLSGDVNVILEPGILEVPDSPGLTIDVDPLTINWDIPAPTGGGIITTINGIQYPNNFEYPVINIIVVPPTNGGINVVPGNHTITLESSELLVCNAYDPIDDYIKPTSQTVTKILDNCYKKEGGEWVRDTITQTNGNKYGFDWNLPAEWVDSVFDNVPEWSKDPTWQ